MVNKKKLLIVLSIAFGGIIVAASIATPIYLLTSIKLTLISNEGVMIEAKGVRIYIDPIYFPQGYEPKPADFIMITHPHTDHYQPAVIERLQKEDTLNIFPETMSEAIALFNGTGMVPEDILEITDKITVTAFYEYTIPDGNHPRDANLTSYIINIDGFVIFHAGDSGNITEYEELTGLVDLAMLPFVPDFLMTEMELVDVFNTIQAEYVMLIHASYSDCTGFFNSYGHLVNAKPIILDQLSSHRF